MRAWEEARQQAGVLEATEPHRRLLTAAAAGPPRPRCRDELQLGRKTETKAVESGAHRRQQR